MFLRQEIFKAGGLNYSKGRTMERIKKTKWLLTVQINNVLKYIQN